MHEWYTVSLTRLYLQKGNEYDSEEDDSDDDLPDLVSEPTKVSKNF